MEKKDDKNTIKQKGDIDIYGNIIDWDTEGIENDSHEGFDEEGKPIVFDSKDIKSLAEKEKKDTNK